MIKLLHLKSSFRYSILIKILLLNSSSSHAVVNFHTTQSHKVTLVAVDIPLKNVFKTITKQTGIIISNNYEETKLSENKKVAVHFEQTDINEVMNFLLSDENKLTFSINRDVILIYKYNGQPAEFIVARKRQDTSITKFPISGKVTDIIGNSLPGATIKVKNTNRGTISNADGAFQLSNVSPGDVIIISSIGFESSEVRIKNKNIIAPLKPYTNKLDENVVIAYGNTTRRFNTGNIGNVKAIDIEKQPVNNPMLALEGRVAGVYIEQASGLPGTGISINIQGTNSISSGNDPFFVIDGVPYISQLVQPNIAGITAGSKGLTGNPLNFINPSTIESIEVLKDADATAIYGSRAANGAILITTKKGKIGSMKVDLNVQNGWGKVGHKLNVLNTKEYLAMRHEALKNDNQSATPYDYDLSGTWDSTQTKDWQKDLIGGSALYRDMQLSFSGGNSQTQYIVNGGYHKETTVFPGDFSDVKGSLFFNLNSASENKKFRVQLSGSYMRDNNQLPTTDLTGISLKLAPIAPSALNPDGSLNWQPTSTGATTFFANPLVYTKLRNTNKSNNLTSNAIFSYDLYPGLTLKTSLGFNTFSSNEIFPYPVSALFPEAQPRGQRTTTFSNSSINSWLIEPQLSYTNSILNGKLNVLIGFNIQNNNSSREVIQASGFNNDLIMKDLKSATTFTIPQSVDNTYKYNAGYGRLTYNWMDKYIVNFTARRDGSSRFGPRNQFHNFGAVGAAWIFSQAAWIQQLFPFLSFGKIRASYGTTGNDQIPDYQYLDLYQTIPAQVAYQGSLGVAPNRLFTPDLQWEETKKLQAGLELGFLKDRILFTANYNRNRSSNQLISVPLSNITGFLSVTRNFNAIVQNTGWEFSINSTNIKTQNFSWTSYFNLTIPKNKLVSFASTTNTIYKVGLPITAVAAYQLAGVNDTTGLYQFFDEKGSIVPLPSTTTTYINIDPIVYGGLQNSFTYKKVSLDLFFQFSKRTAPDLSLGYGTAPGRFNLGQNNQPVTVLDRWQNSGDRTSQAKFTSNSSLGLLRAQSSDAAFSDAFYVRLKNVSLSWILPTNWIQKIHIQSARIYMLGQNLITFTNYFGLDPESRGLGLPPLRVITFGAQITF